MSPRIPRGEIASLLEEIFQSEKVAPKSLNRYSITFPAREMMVYVSQSKPSTASRGHWKYDFFHTISMKTLEEILDSSGTLILVNYVDRLYIRLNPSDIGWALRYSSRNKSNDGAVTDFVVESKVQSSYVLRPYDRLRHERRPVEGINF